MKRLLILAMLSLSALCAQAQYSAVRINLLGLSTGTFNAGFDVSVAEKWSVEGSVFCNPVNMTTFRSKALGISAGVRNWRFEPHVGSFLGIQTTTAKYDFGGRNHHFSGWMTGIGASYGYSWLLSTRWNFTLELGIGCYYMRDKRQNYFTPDDEDIYIRHYRRIVLAPSRAEISFSYLF